MADEQGSSKPCHSNTSKLDEGSLNGVPVHPAPIEEMTAAEKSEIRRRHESASATSKILREERSNASYTGGGQHLVPEPDRRAAEQENRGTRVPNLDSSFLSVDERGNIVPKTPKAALVATQAYLLTMQPTSGDP
jgi:hypothetical protein